MSDNLIKWLGLSLGWGLVALGALVFLRALFADRARGRRRCPRCWYLMTGVPGLTCPECGRTAKKEKRLLKTRRRWRRALAACLLALLGVAAMIASGALRVNWIPRAPTLLLIRLAPISTIDWLGTTTSEGLLTPDSFDALTGMRTRLTGVIGANGSGAQGWRLDVLRELQVRVDADRLSARQAAALARRLREAGKDDGFAILYYDCTDLLPSAAETPSADRFADLFNKLRLTFDHRVDDPGMLRASAVASGVSAAALSRQVLSRNPLESTPGIFDQAADRTHFLGPVLLLDNVGDDNIVQRLLTALRDATPQAPATCDLDESGRDLLAPQVQSTQLRLSSDTPTLAEVFAAVGTAANASLKVDWAAMRDFGIHQQDRVAPGIAGPAVIETLDRTLEWLSLSKGVAIHWRFTATEFRVEGPYSKFAEAARPRYSVMRVYDVRSLLARSPTTPAPRPAELPEERLISDLRTATAALPSPRPSIMHFSGRLIVVAEPSVHVAIEARLQSLAARPRDEAPP